MDSVMEGAAGEPVLPRLGFLIGEPMPEMEPWTDAELAEMFGPEFGPDK